MAQDDRARLERLLDDQADLLPMYDRIDASRRIGRERQAQQYAFSSLEKHPYDDELHLRLTELAMPPAAVDRTEIKRFRVGGFSYNEESLRSMRNITPGLQAGFELMHRNPSAAEAALFGTLPGRDNNYEVFARQRFQADNVTLALTRRSSLANANGGRLEWRTAGERTSSKLTTAGRSPCFGAAPNGRPKC